MEVPDLLEETHSHVRDSDDDEEGWEECMEDENATSCKCLFCSECFLSADSTFVHCQEKHNFNIKKINRSLQLDCFTYIKMINYIRHTRPNPEQVQQLFIPGHCLWEGDEFMKPVIEDDGLLQFDVEILNEEGDDTNTSTSSKPDDKNGCRDIQDDMAANAELCAAAAGHHRLLQRLNEVENRASLAEERLQQALSDLEKMRIVAKDLVIAQAPVLPSSDKAIEQLRDDEDGAYFDSYGHFNIHQEMLQDKVRTESYRDAICRNEECFRDKVVLDVGCGTGILSMLAARAGAKLVIGVDMSEIIYQAMDIVDENGLSDKIKLVKGRMEDVDLPVEKVDIIISEWMGYFLLFESMLDTVLWARDHYLIEGGIVLPDRSDIYLVAVDDQEMHQKNYGYWDDVYGFKMTCMKESVMKEANVVIIEKEKVISDPCLLKTIDICTCKTSDLEFTSPFQLPIQRDGSVTALATYFDIDFSKGSNKVHFSTSPAHIPTHWKQTAFLLDVPIHVSKGDSLDGQLICMKNRRDPRSLIVHISTKERTFKYMMQ